MGGPLRRPALTFVHRVLDRRQTDRRDSVKIFDFVYAMNWVVTPRPGAERTRPMAFTMLTSTE